MLDHAAPEPAQGAGPGGADQHARSGVSSERARAGSAASFRALTERLKASAGQRPGRHVLRAADAPVPLLSVRFEAALETPGTTPAFPQGQSVQIPEPEAAPVSEGKSGADLPVAAPDSERPPAPDQSDGTRELLEILADPVGATAKPPLAAIDSELAQVLDAFLGEPAEVEEPRPASHEARTPISTDEVGTEHADAGVPSEAPDWMPPLLGSGGEEATASPTAVEEETGPEDRGRSPEAPDRAPALAGLRDGDEAEPTKSDEGEASSEETDAKSSSVDETRPSEAGLREPEGRDTSSEPAAASEGGDEGPPSETGPEAAAPAVSAQHPEAGGAETARMLLDIMSMPSGASQPQERALAADTLLRIVDRMPPEGLTLLAERLSIMEAPPPLLVRRLLAFPSAEVAAPLLERCNTIPDQDLIELSASVDTARLRMIARRRRVSSALVDVLIRHRDPSLDLTLIRNPNAMLSHEAFSELGERAKDESSLQAPLATRADTPAPVAFELFWHFPAELRRYVLSRFLTDSSTLERILAIARNIRQDHEETPGPGGFADRGRLAELAGMIEDGEESAASRLLSELAGICEANARRIIADPGGEPLMVAMKALGMPRAQFAEAVERWRRSPGAELRPDRDPHDLQALFDSLSFNKARVLLTYWDWAALRSGPYERQAA